MIVAMKKVFIFMQAKDAEQTTKKLGKIGMLHIEHQRPPKGEDINVLQNDLSLINEALAILSGEEISPAKVKKESTPHLDWKDTCRHIINLKKRIEQLQNYALTLQAGIKEWQLWGDFAPEKIKLLQQKNIFIRFYHIPVKELNSLPSAVSVQQISVRGGMVNCAVISLGRPEIKFKEIPLPQLGLEEMRKRSYEDEKIIHTLKLELKKYLSFYEFLKLKKKDLLKQLEFLEAVNGMGKSQDIMYLGGFAPVEKEQILLNAAKQNKWAVFTREPTEDDVVPTLIRNPRWISLISPIFKLLEVIPGYRELDISVLFLLFFSLFFGMIIGDAGYGFIYLLLTSWSYKKFGRKLSDKKIFFLLYVLSSCAIVWGLMTGTVFGQQWYLSAGLKPLIPALNNPKTLQTFCFFLGALHLTLAHFWRALLQLPAITAAAEIGWIAVLWAGFLLAKTLILGDIFPAFGKWLIIAGVSLVILFSHPHRNIFKAVTKGLATVALSLMNNFTDIVSYIRLFAVGLAGVAIADTVNTLAQSVGGANLLIMAPILLCGHTINLILGPMSVLVHGVRLNVLEFAGHAGVTWSGLTYKPLQE